MYYGFISNLQSPKINLKHMCEGHININYFQSTFIYNNQNLKLFNSEN